MKKALILTILILLVNVVIVPTSYAHVLITDSTDTKGAILHINPDDDPIAGQPATLFLDTQGDTLGSSSEVRVDIKSLETNKTDSMAVDISDSVAIATYTFPSQGVYLITFTVTNQDKVITFQQSQRVSRGYSTESIKNPTHTWAEIFLLASAIGLVITLIIAFNNRRSIAKHSHF